MPRPKWQEEYERKREQLEEAHTAPPAAAQQAPKHNGHHGSPKPAPAGVEPMKVWTGDELMATTFPTRRWIAEQVLPSGTLATLVADSKVGKGWVAYDLARAVETGGLFLDRYQCEEAPVIYFDLEQGEDRSQERWRKILPNGQSLSSAIRFVYRAKRMDGGLLEELDAMILDTGAKLVIFDVIEGIWPEKAPTVGGNAAHQESKILRKLQYFAQERALCILGLHHTNNSGSTSGTYAMRSVPDVLWKMEREPKAKVAKLEIKGRSVAELGIDLTWRPDVWGWAASSVDGAEDDRVNSATQQTEVQW